MMARAGAFFTALAMGVTTVCVVMVVALEWALPFDRALLLGAGSLFGLALFHLHLERRRDRRWLEGRVGEIATTVAATIAEMEQLTERVTKHGTALEARLHADHEALAAEIEAIGQLIKHAADAFVDLESHVGEDIAALDTRIKTLERAPSPRFLPLNAEGKEIPRSMPGKGVMPLKIASPFEREVEAAIRAERIELYLQAIVNLPQRKTRQYEVLSRLRLSDDTLLPAAEFLPAAEARRIMPRLDTVQVIRAFQILKRLVLRNREIGLVINLTPASLGESAFFREFSSFLKQNKDLADLVQFEFTQKAVEALGLIETESLKAIHDLGFHFSLDQLSHVKMNFRALADQGFRTIKIEAERLLGRAPLGMGDIHLADLSSHLQRQGLMLVASHVENEAQVVELMEYDIRLAQGFLFAAPRPVRANLAGAREVDPPEARSNAKSAAL